LLFGWYASFSLALARLAAENIVLLKVEPTLFVHSVLWIFIV
jgi:hypothetical protein